MESLLDVGKEEAEESARVTDEDLEKEKDREIAFAVWSVPPQLEMENGVHPLI
jgi:hypothetical protein